MWSILAWSPWIFAGLFTSSIENVMKNTNQGKEEVIFTEQMSLSVFKV